MIYIEGLVFSSIGCILSKTFNQIAVDSNKAFVTYHISIKAFMDEWLIEEITFLEKRMESAESMKEEGDFQDFKIVSSLSVYQLGYLIHQ